MEAEQLQKFLDDTAAHDSFQADFRPGSRTKIALVVLMNNLQLPLDKGNPLLLRYIYISLKTLIASMLFLLGKTQKAVIGDAESTAWDLSYRVPQGCVLSTVLFNAYVKTFNEIIISFVG